MRRLVAGLILSSLTAVTGCSRTASVGPNGGDLVSIKGDSAYAELLANPQTGEVIVRTWDGDLNAPRPIEREPITVGSGEDEIQLRPYPTDTDPAGTCSRFYGQADWARGGDIRRGWMRGPSTGPRREFEWRHGWEAGRRQSRMWEDIGDHRRMGPEHAPGSAGPMDH